MLTPRLKQILEVMLRRNEVISVKELAEQVGVSKRTVQRELEYIGRVLKSYGVTFESKTGVGVWIEGDEDKKEALLEEIASQDNYDTANREDRRKRLTLEILKEKGLKKLFVYSSKFKVSEATISGDLEIVEKWLNQYGMKIIRKPGSGVYVEGSEKNYRKAIRAFINENMNTQAIWDAYETPFDMTTSYENIKKSGIGQMLEEDTMQRVVNCIMELKNPQILSLTEHSYMGLVLHISIAINRMIQEETIEIDHQWLDEFEEDEDYLLAEDIAWSLEEEFNLVISDMEITYICLHLKGAKHENIHWEGRNKLELDNQEVRKLVNQMIEAFDLSKAFLLRRDQEFIQGLLAHLQPTLIRLNYDLAIENPILEGIKRDYADIFDRCRDVAKVIEAWSGHSLPEAEIGFLTVHFGAALVRAEGILENLRPVNVAVVCSSGIGISRLMSSKLEKIFQDRMVIKTYGKRDMIPFEQQKYDFCITSISLEKIDIPCLEVNPLLTDEDVEKIRELVRRYERTPRKKRETMDTVSQMEEVQVIATQINHIVKYMKVEYVKPDITFEELLSDISRTLSPYEDYQEEIRKSIADREKIATQVYAEFDFALLHARTTGVSSPTFNIWVTESREAFADSYFRGIHTAFVMLLPIDDNIQINTEILGYISSMLIEDALFLSIIEQGDKEEIRSRLSIQLKKFFSGYLLKYSGI